MKYVENGAKGDGVRARIAQLDARGDSKGARELARKYLDDAKNNDESIERSKKLKEIVAEAQPGHTLMAFEAMKDGRLLQEQGKDAEFKDWLESKSVAITAGRFC